MHQPASGTSRRQRLIETLQGPRVLGDDGRGQTFHVGGPIPALPSVGIAWVIGVGVVIDVIDIIRSSRSRV